MIYENEICDKCGILKLNASDIIARWSGAT